MRSANGIRKFLWALPLFAAVVQAAEVPVPPLSRRVTDLTGTLSAEQESGLEAKLKAFESAKGAQVAVLIVPTTGDETIEQYSLRVAENWKLGRKGIDDGVLLLVAKNDRRLRVEVGYGLEGALPDATCKRVIDEIITPHFKGGHFYDGIDAGLDRLLRSIDGEPLPAPPKKRVAADEAAGVSAFIVVGGITLLSLGRLLASSIVGVVLFFVVLAFTGSPALAALAAILGGVVLFFLLFFLPMLPKGGSRSSGGWSSGGGGFSSGGGGFSGGGGSFGGGGSSGSW